MRFTDQEEYMLKTMVEYKLLDPIPIYIIRKGPRVKVNRPPIEMRRQEIFNRWKEKNLEKLPEWVKGVQNPDIFYFKLWSLADFLEDLDITQELVPFIDRYDKGLRGEDDELTKKPELDPQAEAEAAFAAAAEEEEEDEGDRLEGSLF